MSATPSPDAPAPAPAPAAKPKPSNAKILIRNVLSNWAGLVLNMAAAFFMSPFLVRNLGDVNYGLWVLIKSTTGYMGMLDGGVRMAVVKFVARANATGDKEISRIVSTAHFLYYSVACIVLVGTIGFAWAFPHIFKVESTHVDVARIVVLIAGVSLAVSFTSAVSGGILTGMQRFDISNQIGIGTLVVRTIVIVVMILMGYGLVALALTHLAMQILSWGVINWYARRIRPDIDVRLRDANKESAKQLYGYGSANVISGFGDLLLFRTGELLAAMFIGPAAVTYYAIAGTLLEYLQKLVITMAQTLHPFSSARQAAGDEKALQTVALIGTKMCFLIALPAMAGMIIFGHEFIAAWMGPTYADVAAPLLFAMCVGRLFWIGQTSNGQILLGANRHKQAMWFNVATGVFSFLGGMVAVQKWGLLGMAIGSAVPIVIIHGFITPIYTLRTLHIPLGRYVVECVLRPVAAFVPFTLTLLAIEHWLHPTSLWHIFFAAVAASPVLALGAYFLAFNREERVRYVHRFLPGFKTRAA